MSSEAIEDNRQALKRIVAMLVDMAGLATPFTSPSMAEDSQAVQNGVTTNVQPLKGGEERGATRQPRTPLPRRPGERWPAKRVGEGVDLKRDAAGAKRPTLPRILWQAILRVLRPAEAAARRLIIATSLGMVAPVARLRAARPKPKTMEPLLRRFGLAVMVSRDAPSPARKRKEEDGGETETRIPAFPLLDPPYRLNLYGHRRPTVPPHAAPRIMVPGITEPHRLPPPPSPGDRIAADGLVRRLAALAAVLDDLEAQARRFVRWKARRDALLARDPHIQRRVSPIRRGRPPGARYCSPDPAAIHPPRIREIDKILARAHAMALYALEKPDTS